MSRTTARMLSTALVLALLGACLAAPKPATNHTFTVTEKDKQVLLKIGDTLLVRLESTPSTGYGWKTASYDAKMLRQLGEPVMEQAAKPMPGALQHQVFKFKALASGKTMLLLDYVRPWEKNKPAAKVYKLDVAIAKAHKK